MKTKLKSAEAFAKTVRESHDWPEASISANDCCKYERSAWLDWDRAWTVAQKDQAAEITALKKQANAYSTLVKSQEGRLITLHEASAHYAESVNTLASERQANTILTDEIESLKAARYAYASEFAKNADGDPDVGSIHSNIRAMKAKIAELKRTIMDMKECLIDIANTFPPDAVRNPQRAARVATFCMQRLEAIAQAVKT